VEDRVSAPLSAIVISFNEGRRIAACLESLAFADEIVVVDSGSTDDTVAIARKYTENVCHVPWKGFGPQKRAAVERASHDFILCVDCDERVTPELSREIRSILGEGAPRAGYSVPRRTFLGGREIRHCGWYPDRTVRMFDRRRARFSEDLVHERVIVSGEVGELRNHLLHYSFDGMADLLTKMNRYSDLASRQMHARGLTSTLPDLVLRPAFAFLKTYVMKLGFLDGFEGFAVSVSAGFSTFVKYAKLREIARAGRRERR